MKAKTSAKKTSRSTGSKRKQNPRRSRADRKTDIVPLILQDHKPLKRLIKTLKNSDLDMAKRQQAFEEFAPILLAHAKAEETVLYSFMKKREELREGGFEGDVEHGLAEQMVDEAKSADDPDLWSARVKVLAELVEHHIKEEESELLPDVRRNSEASERSLMGEKYRRLKARLESTDFEKPEEEVESAREQSVAH